MGVGEAHLKVGEVEDEMLPLVPNVVPLKPKEQGKPVEDIVVGPPLLCQGRPSEVSDISEGVAGSADLGVPESGMVSEDALNRDYVVGLLLGRFGLCWTRRGLAWSGSCAARLLGWRLAAEAHSS